MLNYFDTLDTKRNQHIGKCEDFRMSKSCIVFSITEIFVLEKLFFFVGVIVQYLVNVFIILSNYSLNISGLLGSYDVTSQIKRITLKWEDDALIE